MKLNDIDVRERPRERMYAEGPQRLYDAELIAILLRTGTKHMNALDTARHLLNSAGNSLRTLAEMPLGRLCAIDGIGPGKAASVAAAMELGRRLASTPATQSIDNSADAASVFKRMITTAGNEECWCMFLKKSRSMLGCIRISEGSESLTDLNIKKIIRKAMDYGASSIIIAHNHPSGNPKPSVADVRQTARLRQALETFEISLLDHVILSERAFYSFSDETVSKW